MTLGEVTKHEARLGGLAQPGVVGDEKPRARVSCSPHQRHKLVWLDRDRAPVQPDEPLATADHRCEIGLMHRPPTRPRRLLNFEGEISGYIGREVRQLELEQR